MQRVALFVCAFLIGTGYATLLPYIAVVAIDGIGLSPAVYGSLTVAFSVTVIAVSFFLGQLFDRINNRASLVVLCAVVAIVGMLSIFFLRTEAAFAVIYCLCLPFSAVLFSQMFGYARLYLAATHEDSERPISWLRSTFSLAWVISPPIVAVVIAKYSAYSILLLVPALYTLVAAIFGCIWFSNRANDLRDTQTKPTPPQPINWETVRDVWLGVLGMICIRVGLTLSGMAIPLFVLNDLKGTASDVGYAVSIPALVEVPLIIFWGTLAGRYGKVAVIAFSALLFAIYLLLVSVVATPIQLLGLQILNGVAAACLISVSIGYLQEVIPGRLGLSTSLIDVVSVTATAASAVLFGYAASFNYRSVFAFAALVVVIGVAAMSTEYARNSRLRSQRS
ncbi:MFS family permease [Rhizobium leguminosarum]|uniref:MFS family permease n=1 Tax=Rhizobium leguminosarum TaxID=384 RepID=A0AAE2MMN5_RHILE|nr:MULTISPECIES: MFS transporter [Rhizobium]MBB4291984.1 MFS family permease [Rhizobium leguminosarum]MBB4310078.1 MFS family permease [Rhizobium leguminosarum]MBB4419181.1 MFS family permease [Rhizobium leguminosarum]MBB4433984.1 MFS family permease [Rhizobium esperanzae]MBB4531236.1 MFS family permease [Rhizobium leguminosarum]